MAKLNLFVSYAHEDQTIAEALYTMLNDAFGEQIHVFYDKECLRAGEEIDAKLKDELKRADTLLVISTGALRASHSWTGVELGYFIATHEPGPGVRGKVISICTDNDVPPTEANSVSLRFDTQFLHQAPQRAGDVVEIPDSDELLKLLGDLVQEIEGVQLATKRARRDECRNHVRQFKLAVQAVFKTRVKEIRKPQKQFLIRYNLRDVDRSRETLPPEALIVSLGGAIGIFGVPSTHSSLFETDASEIHLSGHRARGRIKAKGMKWKDLQEFIAGDPLALHWGAALSQVVIAGAFNFELDNSEVIVTHDGEKYRLLLTTSTTFYDGAVEASVYLVKALQRKDFGRADTTLLLKGLHIVCRFRFLFLENQSDYYWFNVDGWGPRRLPTMARSLLTELGLMRTEAQEAELHKPGAWEAFVSIEHLEAMIRTWMPLETEIRKLCLRALEPGLDDASLVSVLAELKDQLKLVAQQCLPHNAVLLQAMAAKLAALSGPITNGAQSSETPVRARSERVPSNGGINLA